MKKHFFNLAIFFVFALFSGVILSSCGDTCSERGPETQQHSGITVPEKVEYITVPVDYTISVDDAIAREKYSAVCPRAKSSVFCHERMSGKDTLQGVLVHFADNVSMRYAQSWLDSTSFRPANIKELNAFSAQRNTYTDGRAIFAIGSKEKVENKEYSPFLLTKDHSFRTKSWVDGQKWSCTNKYFFFVTTNKYDSLLVSKR